MNNNELFNDKFSEVYSKLEKFVYWLAGKNANPEVIGMEYDDIVGELMLEMVKSVTVYIDRPINELINVTKRIMDNRVSELKYKHYLTYRGTMQKVSLDDSTEDGSPIEELIGVDETILQESYDNVIATRAALTTEEAKLLFDTMITGNSVYSKRLTDLVYISCVRGNVIQKFAKAKIRPWILAEATFLPIDVVRNSLKEIHESYGGVING